MKALAIVVRPTDGALLVCEGADGSPGGYARPPGGSVEFGELAADAIHREMGEEFGCALVNVAFLTVLENRFALDGVAGHEIDFIFRADLTDPSIYAARRIPVLDDAGVEAIWWTPATRRSRLVPDGIVAALRL